MSSAPPERHADKKAEDDGYGDGEQAVQGAVAAGERVEKRRQAAHPNLEMGSFGVKQAEMIHDREAYQIVAWGDPGRNPE